MRAYTFTNFMLNSVAQGIQPGHCLTDILRDYQKNCPESIAREIAEDWADNHKTMICLNGGNHAGIKNIWAQLEEIGAILQLPCGKFHEDEDTLGGLMTCCGIVVPEEIYNVAALRWFDNDTKGSDRDGNITIIDDVLTPYQKRLAALTRSCSLAR